MRGNTCMSYDEHKDNYIDQLEQDNHDNLTNEH